MNHLKDVDARREATEILIEDELRELKAGKNPVTGLEITPVSIGNLDENTPLLGALKWAYESCGVDPIHTLGDINSIMNYIPIDDETLGYSNLPIGIVKKDMYGTSWTNALK